MALVGGLGSCDLAVALCLAEPLDLVGSLCVSCCWIFVGGPSVVDLLVDTFLWPLYVFWWSSVHPTDPTALLPQAKTVFAHLICLLCLYVSLVFPESLLVLVGFCRPPSCFANLSLIWVHGLWPANHLWFLQATIFLLSLLMLVSNKFL